MLIPSDRHTSADLALWAELEEADRIHYETLRRSGKVERSLTELERFAAAPCHAAFSGGKDSLAVLGLLEAAGLLGRVPVVWLRAVPKANPDAAAAVERAATFFGVGVEVVPYESPVPGHDLTRLGAEAIATRAFKTACDRTAARLGTPVVGMRADESPDRRRRFARWGLESPVSFAPLGRWSLADVYAYAAAADLPLCPVYGMLGGGRWPRDRLRVDALFGERGDGSGRAEWEREYYGDVLRGLEAGRSEASS